MFRRGAEIAAVLWIFSATAAWAGAPPVVAGPSMDSTPTACCQSSAHGSCWHDVKEWLCYHPTRRADCGWCHNCRYAPPPLYTFFMDYGCGNDGGATCQGHAACKTCAAKP